MIIKVKEFLLKQDGDRFDVYKVVGKKDKEGNDNGEREQLVGYGHTIGSALKRICIEKVGEEDGVTHIRAYAAKIERTMNECTSELIKFLEINKLKEDASEESDAEGNSGEEE